MRGKSHKYEKNRRRSHKNTITSLSELRERIELEEEETANKKQTKKREGNKREALCSQESSLTLVLETVLDGIRSIRERVNDCVYFRTRFTVLQNMIIDRQMKRS